VPELTGPWCRINRTRLTELPRYGCLNYSGLPAGIARITHPIEKKKGKANLKPLTFWGLLIIVPKIKPGNLE
jgi:hypothetical protein